MANDYPDVVVGCTGGGSNFSGIAFPFIGAQLRGGTEGQGHRRRTGSLSRASRAANTPTISATQGIITPLVPRCIPSGSSFHPSRLPCRRSALSRHGATRVSHVKELGLIEAQAPITRPPVSRPAYQFARAEGHRSRARSQPRDQGRDRRGAEAASSEGVSRAILFNLCGHGHFDMQAYQDYFAGKLVDQDYDEAELAMALAGLPSVPGQG